MKLALCLVLQEIGGGVGGPGGPGIDNSLPGGGPDHIWWLPGLGGGVNRPDQGLPGGGGRPDNTLPGMGGRPDNTLPGGRPPHVGGRPPGLGMPPLPTHPIYHPDKPTPPGTSPGAGMWVIAYVPGQGFVWVSVTPGVPEKPQPTPPPEGGVPVVPDNTLPATPAPKK